MNCFIVRKGAKGLRTEKIQNKISLRCVQNAGALAAGLPCCDLCLHAVCSALTIALPTCRHLPGRLLCGGLRTPARRELFQGAHKCTVLSAYLLTQQGFCASQPAAAMPCSLCLATLHAPSLLPPGSPS